MIAAEAARQKELEKTQKRLGRMTIADQLKAKRHETAMANFQKYQKKWDSWKKNMGKKLNKDPDSLVVAHSEAYRSKREEYALVTAAIPTFLKFSGNAYWTMSLRDGGERMLQVGNVFSGLAVPEKFEDAVHPEIVLVPGRTHPKQKPPANSEKTHFLEKRKRQGPVACVFIDEAQFLSKEQVWQLARVVDDLRVPIMCYGLRVDFRGELFPGSAALLALADEMREVRTICHCGKKATMVIRQGADGRALKDGAQVQIGGNETYVSLCRKHWREAVGE